MLFDSHCHLNHLASSAWIDEAIHSGISRFLLPAVAHDEWQQCLALQQTNIAIALGTHPWYVNDPDDELLALKKVLQGNSKVAAIGEIGLDFYPGKQPRPAPDLQKKSFESQLILAKEMNFPVIIHCVKATHEVYRLLKQVGVSQGVIHAFTGSLETAKEFVGLGMKLGVGPMLFKSPKTQRAVMGIDLSDMLLETDAPYMTSLQNPLLELHKVAEKLATLKSQSVAHVAEVTTHNAESLFLFR